MNDHETEMPSPERVAAAWAVLVCMTLGAAAYVWVFISSRG